MPNAVIDQVVDGVVSLITAAWSPVAPDAVTAVDLPFDELASIRGTQVQVFAGRYSDNGCVDRKPEFDMEYTITILIFQENTNAGDPTLAMGRTFRAFVEQKIFNSVKDPTKVSIAITTTAGDSYVWPLRVDEVISYDPMKLKFDKLFWSQIVVTFQGVTPI